MLGLLLVPPAVAPWQSSKKPPFDLVTTQSPFPGSFSLQEAPFPITGRTWLVHWELVTFPTSTLEDPFSLFFCWALPFPSTDSAIRHRLLGQPCKKRSPSEIATGTQGPQNNAVSFSAAGTVSLASTLGVAGSWSVHSSLACGNQVWFLLGQYYSLLRPLIERRIPFVDL